MILLDRNKKTLIMTLWNNFTIFKSFHDLIFGKLYCSVLSVRLTSRSIWSGAEHNTYFVYTRMFVYARTPEGQQYNVSNTNKKHNIWNLGVHNTYCIRIYHIYIFLFSFLHISIYCILYRRVQTVVNYRVTARDISAHQKSWRFYGVSSIITDPHLVHTTRVQTCTVFAVE